jgi:GNAT superfamily N-acetyltransferase
MAEEEIENEYEYTIEARTEEGGLAAGIVFTVCGQWLKVDFLWVDDKQRGNGIGTRLLAQAEETGKNKGCKKACLTTFNFQARPFYLKHGYRVVYVQRNYPITNERYHMEKDL